MPPRVARPTATRPNSAVYLGPQPPSSTPPDLPQLPTSDFDDDDNGENGRSSPEEMRDLKGMGQGRSALPSPPATNSDNSTGSASGSARGDALANKAPTDTPQKIHIHADDDLDDLERDENDDGTARYGRPARRLPNDNIQALQRVRELSQRNHVVCIVVLTRPYRADTCL